MLSQTYYVTDNVQLRPLWAKLLITITSKVGSKLYTAWWRIVQETKRPGLEVKCQGDGSSPIRRISIHRISTRQISIRRISLLTISLTPTLFLTLTLTLNPIPNSGPNPNTVMFYFCSNWTVWMHVCCLLIKLFLILISDILH